MRLGLTKKRWLFDRLLAQRLFPSLEPVSESARRVYMKLWTTNLPPFVRRHAS